jgi:hypothetical protein
VTMDEMVFNLKHHWSSVNCQPLELYGFRLAAIHISAMLLWSLTHQAEEPGEAQSDAKHERKRRRVAAPHAQRTGPQEATAAPCLVSGGQRPSTPPPGERRVVAGGYRGRLRPRPALAAAAASWPPADPRGGLDGPARHTPGPTRRCQLSPEARLVGRRASGGLGLCACPGVGAGPTARPTQTATALAPQKTLTR